jgi:ketosteroid isomerase-like protein
MMADHLNQSEVKEFLKRFVTSYESGGKGFFELFANDASVFSISVPTRIDGVEEFRRGFEDSLGAGQKRRAQILSPEIRIAGNTAIVSYHNRVAVDSATTNMRATMVLAKDGKAGLKIIHLHNSPLVAAGVPPVARRPEDITLLEERVATAAAAVGTPK